MLNIYKKFISLLLLFAFLIPACTKSEPVKKRGAILAGTWYPEKHGELLKAVDQYMDRASETVIRSDKKPVALIVPHAAYEYSGLAAAYGYSNIKGKSYKRVIILAPSHYASFNGVSITDDTQYETPLGVIELDRTAIKDLFKNPLFHTVTEAHTKEHSIEIQLPLLQRAISNFKLIPLVLGEMGDKEYTALREALSPLIDKNTLIIASSDFTHHGPRFNYMPFKNQYPKKEIRTLDFGAIDLIMKKNFQGFINYTYKTGITICGFRPIAALLKLLPDSAKAELLHYYTSGDITNDFQNSVSYAAIAFWDNLNSAAQNQGYLKSVPLSSNYATHSQGNT